MSEYTQSLIRLQDALSRGQITQREYRVGAAQVRRRYGRLGWSSHE